jgi:uncharacterized membrane protein
MGEHIVNFFHLFAAAVWIGGSIFARFILMPAMSQLEPVQAGKLMGYVSKRFSITSWISLLILIITGAMKTPAGMMFDTSSDMGRILTVKHLLIIFVLAVGVLIAHIVGPRLRRAAPQAGEKPSENFVALQRRMKNLSTTNIVLAVLILVCASMLW